MQPILAEEKENIDPFELLEKKQGKKLYDYQHGALEEIFNRIKERPKNYNLLYQLPTGGGKTVIFSEIAKRYIQETQNKVLILTHRIELCKQTSNMLTEFGVLNKIVDSSVKEVSIHDNNLCYVAMVETLNNRLKDEKFHIDDIGLVIVDEAHYNSFRKMFKFFENEVILGVTATPLSSNIKLPMNETYDELIVGESIGSLVDNGFLAKAHTYTYDVNLEGLSIGMNGDYTVASSEKLYTTHTMQDRLLAAYQERASGKKCLIFNNGIKTSIEVYHTFKMAKIPVAHLDNTTPQADRKRIIDWFRETPNAVITSVGILTMGFDEPTVECIILNRATRSLTLYHQMIGRGSRILPDKKQFSIIDLGNNTARFGLWGMPLDWANIFKNPSLYYDNLRSDDDIHKSFKYKIPDEIRERFPNSLKLTFDIDFEYDRVMQAGGRPKEVLDNSLEQHIQICFENSEDIWDALELVDLLDDEIEYRIRLYSYHINGSKNYIQWLNEDYRRKLRTSLRQRFNELELQSSNQ